MLNFSNLLFAGSSQSEESWFKASEKGAKKIDTWTDVFYQHAV